MCAEHDTRKGERRQSLTYGVMPVRAQFEGAFQVECPGGVLTIENNGMLETLGYGRNNRLTCAETWELVSALVKDWENGDRGKKAAFEAACIMQALGFEWI